LELISTEKIEFPIINNGKALIDDNFLKIIVEKANKNLENGWIKIEKLLKILN
jgi:tRNA(Phe) wybutosine-synthesizing methylase Tyw3